MNELEEDFFNRVEKLTGEKWCPYTHEYHHEIMSKANDDELKEFVNKRRTFMFPSFLGKEPQWEMLNALIDKYKVGVEMFAGEDF